MYLIVEKVIWGSISLGESVRCLLLLLLLLMLFEILIFWEQDITIILPQERERKKNITTRKVELISSVPSLPLIFQAKVLLP